MKITKVKTSTEYEVVIGKGLLDSIAEQISTVKKPGRCVIVSDDTVWALYGEKVKQSLICAGYNPTELVFPHGEESKNTDTVFAILRAYAEHELTRTDFAIALGGGVVGDTCGFASSIYLRGIDFVQIPTTFLAAIDSSVGGKTGVNSDIGKNLIGAFHQPIRVICDTDTFETLPYDIFTAGACEALKYGIICDKSLFDTIKNNIDDIEEIVYRCVSIKRDIVEEDEFDTGKRQLLNLGHTIGHAIEKASHFGVSHGHGVGLGMYIIAKASESKGLCEAGTSDSISEALKALKAPYEISEFNPSELAQIALSDKKRKGDKITLVIPKKIGDTTLHTINIGDLSDFIEAGF